MNDTRALDPSETALLAELRREVAEHPAPLGAPEPARRRPPRRRLRLAAVVTTGAAASAAAALGLGALGGSPAFAVDTDSDGDVIVTVHRLDDAAGLQAALRAQGIDADVSYDGDRGGATFGVGPDGQLLSPEDLQPLPDPGPVGSGGEGPTLVQGGGPAGPDDAEGPSLSSSGSNQAGVEDGSGSPGDSCGDGDEQASLTQDGSDWVLRIPADSLLQDRHVEIDTDAQGGLSVLYAGDQPGTACGLMTLGAPAR